jgi:hypothetical protein
MWVVNKYGFMLSNTVTSKVPMIVNKMIIAMVATIGPTEFSAKADKQIDNVATVKRDKNATQKPNPKRHKISAS